MARSSAFCLNHAPLEYDGPREVDTLWGDERFHFSSIVKRGTGRVASMRPVFNDWSCVAEFNVETGLINGERVDQWMQVAGTQIGLCDWRPQHGRFEAVRIP